MSGEDIYPGEIIRDELEERGWTQEDLSRILGRPLPAVSEIIMGKRSITSQTARELAEAFGTSAEYWMNLEAIYQLRKNGVSTGQVGRMARIFESAPVKMMEKRGWIKAANDPAKLEAELCRFYRIDSLQTEPRLRIAARASVMDDELTSSQIAWSYRAWNLGQAVACAPYSRDRLLQAIPKLRELAAFPESARHVPRLLAEHGVRLVIVEYLPGARIDGVTVSEDSTPIVALSLRFDRIDYFWHTLIHELVHVLNGDGTRFDIDLSPDGNSGWSIDQDCEAKANEEAADMLIPRAQLESFILRVAPLFSKTRINQFANRVRIHPGIVVGQLQRRKKIGYSTNREMLVKIREHIVGQAMTDGFGHTPQGI